MNVKIEVKENPGGYSVYVIDIGGQGSAVPIYFERWDQAARVAANLTQALREEDIKLEPVITIAKTDALVSAISAEHDNVDDAIICEPRDRLMWAYEETLRALGEVQGSLYELDFDGAFALTAAIEDQLEYADDDTDVTSLKVSLESLRAALNYPQNPGPGVTEPGRDGFRPGQQIVVALEMPGPGNRKPEFLRNVEGEVAQIEESGTLNVWFPITEENVDDWEALMPDQPPPVGERLFIDLIEPEWVVSK